MKKRISIICCYRSEEAWLRLQASLSTHSSILLEYIGVDNQNNGYTLPDAYNMGVSKSTGELLVFVHDDVEFLNNQWLEEVWLLFQDDSIGLAGSAGGTEFFDAPSTWWFEVGENLQLRNMQQMMNGELVEYHDCQLVEDVVCLDGFLLICSRANLADFKWSNSIGSWHGYDLDLSLHMKIVEKKRNVILPMTFARHHSLGTLNEEWAHSMLAVWVKYSFYLSNRENRRESVLALILFVNWTHRFNSLGGVFRTIEHVRLSRYLRLLSVGSYSTNRLRQRLSLYLLDSIASYLKTKVERVGFYTKHISALRKARSN